MLIIAQYVPTLHALHSFVVLYAAIGEPLRAFAPDFVPTLNYFYGRQPRPYINPRRLYQYLSPNLFYPEAVELPHMPFYLTSDGKGLATDGAELRY